jgi:hypothetical protein
MDKQWSTKHYTKNTKDRATRTPLQTSGKQRCSIRVSSSCYTSGTRRVTLVTKTVMNECVINAKKTGKCLRQVEHIRGHLWHRYSITVDQLIVTTVGHLWHRDSVTVDQIIVTTVKRSKWWFQFNQLVQCLPCLQQLSIRKILIGTTSSGILKIEIISLVE